MPVSRIAAVHAEQRGHMAPQVVWAVENDHYNCSNRPICIVRPAYTCFRLVPRRIHSPLLSFLWLLQATLCALLLWKGARLQHKMLL